MLVDRIVQKYDVDEKSLTPEKRVVQTSRSWFRSDDKIVATTGSYLTGVSRKSPHRYWRWQTDSIYIIKRGKTGFYAYSGGYPSGGKRRWVTVSNLEGYGIAFAGKEDLVEDFLGTKNLYPLAEHFGIATNPRIYFGARQSTLPVYTSIPNSIALRFQTDNPKTFVTNMFGMTRYRKDLLKAVSGSNLSRIMVAADFRGLVPIDWIITFLRNSQENERNVLVQMSSLRRKLFNLDPRSYRSLLLADDFNIRMARDIVNGREFDGDNLVRNWRQFHDRYWGEHYAHRTITWEAFEDKDIEQSTLMQQLDALVIPGLSVKTAKNTAELSEWGNFMHNCIGGYRSSALSGQTLLGAVHSEDMMIANFEIRNGGLQQLLGKYNQPVAQDAKTKITRAMQTLGIKTTNYWGE